MKKIIPFLIVLMLSISIQSQNFPTVTLEDKSELMLDKLRINAEISGNYATVTYDMTFYNGHDRVLEGELAFPLAEGQSVSHFAMDLNGKLRSAVIVEKELGRVAYENTIRQRIDPALLEQTQGNNYKARVYPIPAKGHKRIVITYEQNLLVNDNHYQFNMPLGFSKPLNDFSIDIVCHNLEQLPSVTESFKKDLKFIKKGKNVVGTYVANSVDLNRNLKLSIPIKDVFALQTFEAYFHINKTFVPKRRLKSKAKSITILWDASYSMHYKKLEAELNLITSYLKSLEDVKVSLVVFSNTLISNSTFRIKNGDSQELINTLKKITYDGGTSYKGLSIPKSDDILLFSDGLHNLGELELSNSSRLYCINSVNSANHQLLNDLATENSGNYINLNSLTNNSAVDLLKHEAIQFLGVNHDNSLFEVYPKPKSSVNENFNLSGKFMEEKSIELLFGYGNEITERIFVDLTSSSNSEVSKRLWAKAKLQHLTKKKEENKNDIIELAKAYHLISPYTSMIVLDRIEDYVRYKIEPPSELKEEYNRRLAQSKLQQQHSRDALFDRREELKSDYESIRSWYDKDFNPKANKPEKKVAHTNPNTNNTSETTSTNTSNNQSTNTRLVVTHNIDSTKAFVHGVVTTSSDGLPLPGASVIVKGTSRGVQTDFDGKFVINASPNETLVFSFVGMTTVEQRLSSDTTLNMELNEDASTLDEVIVIGYGTTTKEAFTGAVTTVRSESIATQLLSGQVAGVNVNTVNGTTGSNTTIKIRGFGTMNGNREPLYIVDGIPYVGDLSKISTDEIISTTVLKDTAATAIYGSRGSNGIVVITTKNGAVNHKKEIEVLNEKIVEQSTLQNWDKNASYIQYLKAQNSVEEAYKAYLKIRENYRNTPSFFLDIADFFESKNRIDIALRVATNLIEIDLDNHELIRALAYKLEQYKKYDLAIYVYKNVLELRPEHPQSYRDLALAYEANGDIDAAIDLLLKIVNGQLLEKDEDELYYGIEQIAYVELCHLVNTNHSERAIALRGTYEPIETDIRVVVDWNHGETDLDLYVKNPDDEEIYYGHDTSKFGGRISEDLVDGYGPESYWIKKAQKGNYEISVDYYSDSVQKITGPAGLKVTIFRNYGKPNEEKEIKVFRLSDEDTKRKVETITL
ncbi:VIT domain-containing protein [Winogradskyella psychrotolerans]|uniref:VIT domain-containing protein n=1 Tax=Winogradskyella psychrotolerans TaxID=1344585 RepID=UPI001C079F8E|nr:VIT domain-containing protein [Winogradskyella psychrotolerans]MBU2929762.1 carboxypeptidase-like regulatory domain-containing protein [Winogradskyella psychrotolerans]